MRCLKCNSEYSGNYCPFCGTASNATHKKAGVLLGFRSNKLWKKILSVCYLLVWGLIMIVRFSGGKTGLMSTYDFLIEKVSDGILILIFLSPYIFLSNTKLRTKLPLFKKRNAGLSVLGMIIATFVLFIIFGSINSIHSKEYQNDKDNHAYVMISTEDASCTTDGKSFLKCEYCGDETEETIPATGHQMIEQHRTEANCVSTGSIFYICEHCAERKTEQIAATGHLFSVISKVDATCKDTGSITSKCTLCEEELTEEIAILPHNWVESSRKEATCTKPGEMTLKCEFCKEKSTQELAILPHDWEESSRKEATCFEAGKVISKCKVCKEKNTTVIETLPHSFIEVSRVEATDLEDGEIVSKCEICHEENRIAIPCKIAKGSLENPHKFDAQDLFDLSEDGISQKAYQNKWVNISGTVLSISDYGSLKGYYLTGSAGNGVVCWVDGDTDTIQNGQTVVFVGQVSVADTKHIEINRCQVMSVTWPEEKLTSPVTISKWQYSIDFLGGVEWTFKLTNNTDKTIKYVVMEWQCYNGVGELIRDDISGETSYSIRYTGPLKAGKTTSTQRNTKLFYNHSYRTAKLTKLQVEFMDGTIINVTTQGYDNIIDD